MAESDRGSGGHRAAAFAELGARSNFSRLDGWFALVDAISTVLHRGGPWPCK